MDSNKIGLRLKKLREAKSLTLEKLATVSGVSQNYIWKLEDGRIANVGLETYEAIAKGLDMPLEYLLFGELHAANTMAHTQLQNALMPGNDLLPITPEEREFLLDLRAIESKKQRMSIKEIIQSLSRREK